VLAGYSPDVHRSKKEETAKVARFPPLPRIPRAPTFPPDPRQATTKRIVGAITAFAKDKMVLAGPNLVEGFPASGVNPGVLQQMMERGLRRFTGELMKERWDDIFDWSLRFLHRWVQRTKQIKLERFESGIRIELQTQDDRGYYDYGFDVFPER
jgi:hypothetical protein